LYGELFKMMAGVDMIHVPYRSGPEELADFDWRTGTGRFRSYRQFDRAHQGWQIAGAGSHDYRPLRAAATGLADSRLKMRIADLGYQAYATSPAEFAKFIGEETDKWAKIVKISGAKAE